jgi:DNA repair protein RAD57
VVLENWRNCGKPKRGNSTTASPHRRNCNALSACMDLLSILPGLSTKQYAHIIPSLERRHITTVDLITLDTLEIAKRARVPPADLRRLCADVLEALHRDLGFDREQPGTKAEDEGGSSTQNDTCQSSTLLDLSQWNTISTLDPALDALLDGGIPAGYLTEITGERLVQLKLEHLNTFF